MQTYTQEGEILGTESVDINVPHSVLSYYHSVRWWWWWW